MNETRKHATLLVCPHCAATEERPDDYLLGQSEAELVCRACGGEILLRQVREGWETSGWVTP